MDENRNKDGLVLRKIYENEVHPEGKSWLGALEDEHASCFEVILGVAIRMEDVLYKPNEDHISEYFWEIVHNLGGNFDDLSDFEARVDAWLERKIRRNGEGGLFPLKKNNGLDQKDNEIWYQMHAYILEKYPVN